MMKWKEKRGQKQSCTHLAQNQEAEQTLLEEHEKKLFNFLFSTGEQDLKYLQKGCLN